MAGKMEVTNSREDEIDLLDLIKILLVNKKIILIIWAVTILLGTGVGVHLKKAEPLKAARKFELKTSSYELNGRANMISVDPIELFEDKNYVESFYKLPRMKSLSENLILEKFTSKKNFLKGVFEVTKKDNLYILKVSGKTMDDIKKNENLYFEELSKFINKNYGEILGKDLEVQKLRTTESKKQLLEIEKRIDTIFKAQTKEVRGSDLRELYPTLFTEKDSIAEAYGEDYKAQKNIEKIMSKLGETLTFRSSLNEEESKLSLRLIFIIANVLGIFSGVFIVFLNEFRKSIDWKELKNLK